MSGALAIIGGTHPFVPVLSQHAGGSSGTETVPQGARSVTIEVWGGGGTGGPGAGDLQTGNTPGVGGGSAGYVRSVYSCASGQTINYTAGNSGANSTVSSGTLTVTTMTSGAGHNYTAGSTGGTATGGNAVNTPGNATAVRAGATAPVGINANTDGSSGKGGNGGLTGTDPGNVGAPGLVAFYYS